MSCRRSAFFLTVDGQEGRFCLVTHPVGEPRGGVVYVHPFAEEMNKSRRMAALAAAAFAERGWLVLQIDLAGCGDSGGDFGDASWSAWLADVDAAWKWMSGRVSGPLCLWGLRAGGLVISDWLASRQAAAPLLLWQPVTDGRQHLTQFLRLKGVGEMLDERGAAEGIAAARNALQGGQAVEVAGYLLSAALADGLGAAKLQLPDDYRALVALLEVAPADRCEPSPALRRLTEQWQGKGVRPTVRTCPGAAFWQTQEIETCLPLVDASVAVLEDLGA